MNQKTTFHRYYVVLLVLVKLKEIQDYEQRSIVIGQEIQMDLDDVLSSGG
jgi:hypothetical protein